MFALSLEYFLSLHGDSTKIDYFIYVKYFIWKTQKIPRKFKRKTNIFKLQTYAGLYDVLFRVCIKQYDIK